MNVVHMLNAERITKSFCLRRWPALWHESQIPDRAGLILGQEFPTVRSKTPVKCPGGMPGRNGCLWNWLVHSGSMVIGHRAEIQLENTVSDIPMSWRNLCITNAILRPNAGIGKTMSGTEPRYNLLQPDNQQLPQSLAVYPLNHDRSFRVKQVNHPSENPS